jgi:hypothetical protein
MEVTRYSVDQVSDSALRSLGLSDVGIDILSTEALAASLRRAASFLCPATPGRLVRSVLEVLEVLSGYGDDTKARLETVLEALIGYGDLLELPTDMDDSPGPRIFLGAPAFVRRTSGSCLLIGVRPDGVQLLGDELAALIDYEEHARIAPMSEDLGELLTSSGLTELSTEQWLHSPRQVTADDLVREYDIRLQAAGPSGEIESPRVLDSSAPITYYRGRWRPPKPADTGTFVARRPRAYGADLWCFARLTNGSITQLIDLPLLGSLVPASDEAWRLQAAIDAVAGHPQRVRVRGGTDAGKAVLDFFSPLPSWAQRSLDVVGTPLMRGRGALFSFGLPTSEVEQELQFLADMLWISTDDLPERTKP